MVKNADKEEWQEPTEADRTMIAASWDTGSAALLALTSRLSKPREPWLPKEGEILAGEVVGKKMVEGGEYADYPLLEVDTPSCVVQVHCFHTMLRNAIEHVGKGELIAICYQGRDPEKRNMARYVVETAAAPVVVHSTPPSLFEEGY